MSETRDIVVRLWGNTGKYPGFENMKTEAAQTIESLRATVAGLEKERDGLREALDNAGLELIDNHGGYPDWSKTPGRVQGALNIIRTALGGEAGKQ